MVTLKLHTQLGVPAGDFDVDESCFAAGINGVLLRQAVKMYTDNRRVGTVKSKSRAEVSGSSRKLISRRAPEMRGQEISVLLCGVVVGTVSRRAPEVGVQLCRARQ